MGLCFSPISASAVLNDFLSGYAWSDAGGWSSFSCVNTDTCNTVNYKVEIDSNGDFSGYAWNDSYGWIFFGATTTCPSGVCQANVASGGTVSGWAKIISEGSNGWISLSGTSPDYGVTYDSITNELGGWAWSDAIGWISFNSTNCDPDGNGLSDSGIEGCPTGSADHWDEVNDDPLGAHDGDITSVYTSSETQQRDAYALEDTTQTGDINEVTIKSYTQGCAELWIIVDGVEYGLGGLACSGDTWGYNSGPTISTFEIPGGFTWDKINNMQVGVGLQQQTFFGTYDGKLTQIWVEVTYDEFEKLNLSPDGDGDYTEIDSPVGGDPPAVPDYAVVSDNSAPNAPTITGPTSGKINENYTFKFETSDFKILHEGAIFDDETTLLGYPRDVLVSGNYAYVANDNDVDKGVEIVDISNPSNPIHAASIPFVSGYGPVKIFLA
ncbi:MAG: hypothetical protein KAS07_02745, partial [Candidatus Pacebacteria bacterium]|nr:hypothetical protein [Candidatus Paceibacterota bacterium]